VGGGGLLHLVRAAEKARMNELGEKILLLVRNAGPLTVAQYMHMALADPEHGYYISRNPFGTGGDFVTAPDISQMFGELIGLSLAQTWKDSGGPDFHLVELGPGRGTLMADLLRGVRKVLPQFLSAANVVLVETSPVLREVQRATLKDETVGWSDTLTGVQDDRPIFVVANEFFDALPVRQFVKANGSWHERMVAEKNGALAFALSPEPVPSNAIPHALKDAKDGGLFEVNLAAQSVMQDIAGRIARSGGAAIAIDYGHDRTGSGDTLQALRKHAFADPLEAPGEADLTAHVDFEVLAATARQEGAEIFGPVTQGAFLQALGIGIRAQMLKTASPDSSADIDAAVKRLTGPDAMGTLFKVIGLGQKGGPPLAGFA